MRKWNSLRAALAVAALFSSTSAAAEARSADGCAVLADIVYGEIFVSALFGGHRLPPEPDQGDAASCDQTAASVSAGFTRAMAAMNVHVTWGTAEPSVVCVTGDLAQCYPLPKSTMPNGALDSASVARMWQIVSGIVSRNMPLGTLADRSSFREYELRLVLSDALVNRYWNDYGWAQPRSAH